MLLRVVLHPTTFRMQNIIPHLQLKRVAVMQPDAFHRIKFDVISQMRGRLTRQKLIDQFPHLTRAVFRSVLASIIQAAGAGRSTFLPLKASTQPLYHFAHKYGSQR